MFSRRMFVAVVACLVMSASSAFAGGGGSKKDSTIKVVNSTANPVYAFVDVTDADILAASTKPDPIAAFKALGGKEIAAGGNSASFSVKTGAHSVTTVDIVTAAKVGTKPITTTKGKTSTVTF